MSADSRNRFWSTDTLAVLAALLTAILVRTGILQKVPW